MKTTSKISVDGWAIISAWGDRIVIRMHRDNYTFRDYHATDSSRTRLRRIIHKLILRELGEIDNS